jgi:type II secretory pathway component GspD/PulD (secretin)
MNAGLPDPSPPKIMINPRLFLALVALGTVLTRSLAQVPLGLAPAPAEAAPPNGLDAMLDRPAQAMTAEKANLAALFYAIGKTYGITVTVDPNVSGTALLRFNGGTLRQLLGTLLDSHDLFMEQHDGVLTIKRTKTEFYFIEYPEIARSASSSTSVSLSPSRSSGAGGFTGIGGNTVLPGSGAAASTGTTGSTSFSISERSDDSFWTSVESDLKEQKQEEEKVSTNRFSGIVAVEATYRRQGFWRDYIKLLNERINAQVVVEVRIDNVTLNHAHKLGVDLSQIQTAIGGSTTVGPAATATSISNLGGSPLPQNTLIGNFASGKLSAVLTALQQQGEIRTIAKPSIRLLNNQKGFVKVGEDRTFYSLFSNVSISQPGAGSSQTTTQNVYQGQQQTFGVVLPVTAQISRDGWVTLVLEPARTQLNGISTSPDNTQTSPDTGDQSISTMLRLRDGESTMLGGLVTKTESKQTNGIPLLGSLPWLGRLARTDAASGTMDELIVTVSVQVIK